MYLHSIIDCKQIRKEKAGTNRKLKSSKQSQPDTKSACHRTIGTNSFMIPESFAIHSNLTAERTIHFSEFALVFNMLMQAL